MTYIRGFTVCYGSQFISCAFILAWGPLGTPVDIIGGMACQILHGGVNVVINMEIKWGRLNNLKQTYSTQLKYFPE